MNIIQTNHIIRQKGYLTGDNNYGTKGSTMIFSNWNSSHYYILYKKALQ